MKSKYIGTEKTRRSLAVTTSSLALALALAPGALAQTETADEDEVRALDTVIVTSSRRAEDQQDTAITLQALDAAALENLGVQNFEDYVALIPGLNASGQGPGKQNIFIRGINNGPGAVRIAGISPEPSVATYFDETPISTGGRNIDLYAADLGRIEVLKGPQGTLFGASSQAGTIRLIPNKPDTSEFSAGGTFGVSATSGSDEFSSQIEGFVNLPIIEDKFAVRLVGYSTREAGFIDNIPAERQIPLTNPALAGALAADPTFNPDRVTAFNTDVAEDDFNDARFDGFRISALYEFNTDWNFLVQHVTQSLESEGVFEFEPEVSEDGDLNVQTFSPDNGDDEVHLTNWTLNGRFAELDLIYTGAYTTRTFEGQTDYTGYANTGPFIPYYICAPGYQSCGSPVLFTQSFFDTERHTHEARFSTSADRRWRVIGGVFFDDEDVVERTDFTYPASVLVGFQPNFPDPAAFASDPNPREPGVTFFNDFLKTRREISFFGEFSYDLLENLTATFGFRRFDIEVGLTGQSQFGTRGVGPEANGGVNVDANLEGQTPTNQRGTIFRGNLEWDVTDDILLYATYSEGFRAGGFNRNGNGTDPATDIPFFFDTDDVKNYEIGWKTEWLNNTLRFNGAAYFVEFTDLQQTVLDFNIDNVSFTSNVGSAELFGVEFQTEWAATDNLTLFGSFSYIDSELTDIPETLVNIVPEGSDLPFAPNFDIVFGGRYDTELFGYNVFAQGLGQFVDERFVTLFIAGNVADLPPATAEFFEDDRVLLDSYFQANLSAGFGKDNWTATLFVDNVGDSLGQITAGAPDLIFRAVPTRPRTVGLRVSFNY
ncbi:MAG: TonB-dependent receptor [Pseudomonadota bacterium]